MDATFFGNAEMNLKMLVSGAQELKGGCTILSLIGYVVFIIKISIESDKMDNLKFNRQDENGAILPPVSSCTT